MIRIANPLNSRDGSNTIYTIIDYRNGKYQGTIETQNRLPKGIGMFLSQDYHLVIGFWKNGQIQGQCLMVFPNGNISFGTFSKGRPKEMACFQLANGKILYTFTYNNRETLCLLQDSYNKIITVVRMHKDSRSQFFDSMDVKKSEMYTDQIKQLKGVFFRKKIQIVEEVRYGNDIQKWIKIQEWSKQMIKSEYKDYKQFIRFNFCNLHKNQIQLTQTKQQVQIRCKKSSIICHLIENNSKQNTLKVKLIGFYDENNRKMQIVMKKMHGISKEVQETCQDQTFTYKDKRPTKVKQKLINYFKKSTHFANIYIKNRQFQAIRVYFQSIYEIIENQISSKNAQTLLQLAYPSQQPLDPSPKDYKGQIVNKNINPLLQLSEVKNKVFNKVSRRKNLNYGRQKSLSRQKVIDNAQIFTKSPKRQRYGQEKENYYSPQRFKDERYLGLNSPASKQKRYLVYAQKQPYRTDQKNQKHAESPSKIRSKKYTYLTDNQHHQSISAFENRQKYDKKQLMLDLYHSRSEYKHQQGKINYMGRYQDPIKHRQNTQKQSIKYLAKDYELINQRLNLERSASNIKDPDARVSRYNKQNYQNSRSPKKFTYLKSPTLSPSSQSNKGKKQWR